VSKMNILQRTCLLQDWHLPALKLWKGCVFPSVYVGKHVCMCIYIYTYTYVYICIYAYPTQHIVQRGWEIWSLMKISGGFAHPGFLPFYAIVFPTCLDFTSPSPVPKRYLWAT
jgi:hypothetical protein